jgi:hypothetical protein
VKLTNSPKTSCPAIRALAVAVLHFNARLRQCWCPVESVTVYHSGRTVLSNVYLKAVLYVSPGYEERGLLDILYFF